MSDPLAPHPRPVLVVGAGGHVGAGLARELVAAGRPVLAASRSVDRLEALARRVADDAGPARAALLTLVPYPGLEGPDGPDGLGAAVRAAVADGAPAPVAAVAAVGGWWQGQHVLDLPLDAWRGFLDSHLTAHLEAVRAVVPLLATAPDPVHVVLNGAASHEAMVGSGPVSVTGAALSMLVQVLRAEQAAASRTVPAGRAGRDRPAVRFHELVLEDSVTGDDRNVDPARRLTPAQAARALERLVDDARSADVVRVHGSPA